jgi:hypothetical protein
MGIATIIALTGNVQLALPGHEKSPFAWLEAVAPPLLVLSTAYVIKEQLLDAIQQRHANERAFQEALHDWQQATSNPESHSHWSQFYANALRDALRKMNARRQDALQDMTIADWRAAIYRELQAEEWYATPKPDNEKPSEQKTEIQPEAEPVPLALNASGNGHGHANGNGSTGKGGV